MLCKDLKENNELLIRTIQGPKLKDEKLMQISLNINEDIVMTLNRYEKSIKGENPGPFLSSFTRDDNPFLNKFEKNINNNKHGIFNNDSSNEEIEKLGFGDTITTKYLTERGNKNNNSLQNNLSDFFDETNKTTKIDIVQTIDLNTKNKNNFYNNMTNSNSNSIVNLSAAKARYPNYSQFLNNQNNKNHLHHSHRPIYETKIIKNDNNIDYKRIADNHDIKILINNNAYKKNNNNYKQIYKSQIFPNMNYNNININERDNREVIYRTQFNTNENINL